MNKFIGQTALAFITIYKALPSEVRQEVRRLMRELDEAAFGHREEWQHLSHTAFAGEWDKPENAYWDVHLTNPGRMDNDVQTEEPLSPILEQQQAERVQQMENVIARFGSHCRRIISLTGRKPMNDKTRYNPINRPLPAYAPFAPR